MRVALPSQDMVSGTALEKCRLRDRRQLVGVLEHARIRDCGTGKLLLCIVGNGTVCLLGCVIPVSGRGPLSQEADANGDSDARDDEDRGYNWR